MRLSFLDIIDKFKSRGLMEFPNEKTVTSLTGTLCLRTPFLSFFLCLEFIEMQCENKLPGHDFQSDKAIQILDTCSRREDSFQPSFTTHIIGKNTHTQHTHKLKKFYNQSKSQSYQSLIASFFRFSLLSLSVCRIGKYCLYFKMAKHNSENRKNEEIKVWQD